MALLIGKSFQNCSENDVAGYNDCPAFLFNKSNDIASSAAAVLVDNNVYSKKMHTPTSQIPVQPPPAMKRKVSRTVSIESRSSLSPVQITDHIEKLLSRPTKMKAQQFGYYKSKLETHLLDADIDSTTQLNLTQFFSIWNDGVGQETALKFLQSWIITDISAGSWLPSLIKICENIN